ncbi:MAG: peptide ABC transporter substrate-binding protein [Deltaproteobacteria bacterium]|nr:peptide ABC transporter substrate-binding protein [Deltaproteobacteria bacterium]
MSNRTILLSLFGIILFSCSSPKPETREIRISLATEPPTLDWNLATDNVSYQILNQLMEGLTQFDDQMNVIPAAAKSWEITDDGKTYLFHLDSNYRWSDGKKVIAEDFRYSWLRLLRPETAAEYAYFLFDIVGARDFNSGRLREENQVGIEVIDPFTLKVSLTKPVVFFPAIATFMVTYPLRKDLFEKYGDNWTDPENMVTCGPYLLKEWWHEYRLKLEKNPLYGGSPRPAIDGITVFLVNEPATVLALYEKGELDIASPPPVALPRYKNHPDMVHAPKLRGYYYGFNTTKKPFDDVRIRQALAMALDKSEIPNILKGGEQPVNSWIPPGMFGFDESIGLKFDPEKGRELLEEAGITPHPNPLPQGERGYFVESPLPRGEGVRGRVKISEITLTFNSDPVNKKIAEWAQGQWKKNLGIDVRLDNQEWKSYLSLLRNDPPGLFRLGWGADYPDPDNFMNLFTSASGNNHTQWKNSEFDRLIGEAATQSDGVKRKGLYDEAQKILLERKTVILPLFAATQNILVREKLRPFPIIPMDFVYYKRVKFKKL